MDKTLTLSDVLKKEIIEINELMISLDGLVFVQPKRSIIYECR